MLRMLKMLIVISMKLIFGGSQDVACWENIYLAWVRPWVSIPAVTAAAPPKITLRNLFAKETYGNRGHFISIPN